MSAEAANRLRGRLGDATGIAVRTSHKYLRRTAIEVVASPTWDDPSWAVLYWRGAEVRRFSTAGFDADADLLGFVLRDVARHLSAQATA